MLGTRGRLGGTWHTSERRLLSAAIVWLVLFAGGTLATEGTGTVGRALVNVAYLGPHLLAFALAIRAARRSSGAYRRLWTMLAAAIPLWIAGEAVVSFHHVVLGNEPPFPGLADGFFLSFYVALLVTFVVALRPALKIRSWKAILDASVLAASVGFVGWVALIAPQLSEPASAATAVGIAYPLMDVAMLTVLISLTFASFQRPPKPLLLLAAAISVGALTDGALAYISLHTTAPELSWLKIGWEADALLLAAAAVVAVRASDNVREAPRADLRDRGLTVVLGGVGATLVVVVVHIILRSFDLATAVIAFYVVVAIAVRLSMTSSEREQIALALEASLREQQRIANTDELTGLPNRRFADRHLLDRSLAGQDDPRPEMGVLVLDLDHFKEINDSHGHPVGDEVLRLAASRLQAACRPGDVVARYGGEEFLVIVHEVPRAGLPAIAQRFRATIAEAPFDAGADQLLVVTTSVGGASMPADAANLTDLLRIADRALYTAKSRGRNRVQIGAHNDEGTIDALMERGSVLNFVQSLVDHVDSGYRARGHSRDTARWAGLVADELGLSAAGRWRACGGARLHDIGKLCVPPEVLASPRPLTEQQWDLVRRHPDAGADILTLAPGLEDIAEVVRQHHEHYDGAGYPHGLAGQSISVEARIVAVCDAWSAMRAERPYRAALSASNATEELLRRAGHQFDPGVVDAFLAVLDPSESVTSTAARSGTGDRTLQRAPVR
jgi:two-component system, cell cycle response regulator